MTRRSQRQSAFRELSEINQTPLIDLSMLLLVTFLITFPLMEHGLHINLPAAKTTELQPQADHRTVSIDAAGDIFLDDLAVTLEELAAGLQADGRRQSDLIVYVRADRNIRYERVMDVMKTIHAAEITRVALVTRAE